MTLEIFEIIFIIVCCLVFLFAGLFVIYMAGEAGKDMRYFIDHMDDDDFWGDER